MDQVTKLDHKIGFPPICHSYFGNSKWPFTVLSISSFCGIGLSVIRSRLRKALSIFSISPLSHLLFPSEPTAIELSTQSIPTKQLLSRSSATPSHQIAKSHFISPLCFSSQQHLQEIQVLFGVCGHGSRTYCRPQICRCSSVSCKVM